MRIKPAFNLVTWITVGGLFIWGCEDRRPLQVAFWNVENLFDLVDDPQVDDEEFALGGRKRVTPEILDMKLDHMVEVLVDLDADLLGLCEVENRSILERLNRRYRERNYALVHYDSPDSRGIDVALLYDPARFVVVDSRPVVVPLDSLPTRDILYVRGRHAGEDLHLFINHWPSNYRGEDWGHRRRGRTARVLRREVEDLLGVDPLAEILIMGDINENPDDENVGAVLGAIADQSRVGEGDRYLWNMMGEFLGVPNGGSYKYRGEDRVLDQIIVSPGLFDRRGLAVQERSIAILDRPQYRQQEGDYTGYPFRFWVGDRLLGGYSDHLAVMVRIRKVR